MLALTLYLCMASEVFQLNFMFTEVDDDVYPALELRHPFFWKVNYSILAGLMWPVWIVCKVAVWRRWV